MRIAQQNKITKPVNIAGRYPDKIPKFSPQDISRNPGLEKWQNEFDRTWFELRTVLMRERETLMDPVNSSIADLEAFKASTLASISGLDTRVSANTTCLSDVKTDLSALRSTINDLSAQVSGITQLTAGPGLDKTGNEMFVKVRNDPDPSGHSYIKNGLVFANETDELANSVNLKWDGSFLDVVGGANITGDVKVATGSGYYQYNTADQVTDYESLFLGFSGNVAVLDINKGGTGTFRDLSIKTGGLERIHLFANGHLTTGQGVLTDQGDVQFLVEDTTKDYQITVASLVGASNRAGYVYRLDTTDVWQTFVDGNDASVNAWKLQFDPRSTAVTHLSVSTGGYVKIPVLTASKPVFTNASKELVSTGTVPLNQGGTGKTSITVNTFWYASSTDVLSETAITSQARTLLGSTTTTNLPEGLGLYWTQSRFDTAFAFKSTTQLAEGTNLYFTNERVDDRVDALIEDGTGISWVYSDAGGTLTPTITLSPFSTSNLSEGSNLYYTQARFDTAFGLKNIDDLNDVVVTSVGDNDMLAYDTGTSKWINQTAVELGLSASAHTHDEVDINDGTLLARVADAEAISGAWNFTNDVSISTGNDLWVFNTADQTTNYEKVILGFDTNVATMSVTKGGTGTYRDFGIKVSNTERFHIFANGHVTTGQGTLTDAGDVQFLVEDTTKDYQVTVASTSGGSNKAGYVYRLDTSDLWFTYLDGSDTSWNLRYGGVDRIKVTTGGLVGINSLTANKPVFTDGSKNLTSSGTVPLNQGGTGATTQGGAQTSLGLGTGDSPAFTGLTLSGLTDNRILIAGSGGVVEGDANLTWDGSDLGVGGTITPTGRIFGIDGTIADPAYSFTSDPATGLMLTGGNLIMVHSGDSRVVATTSGAIIIGSFLVTGRNQLGTGITSSGFNHASTLDVPGTNVAMTLGASTYDRYTATEFGDDTVTGDNAITFTDMATVYIAGAPIVSTNVTATNTPLALWVDSGNSRFDGDVAVSGGITSSDLTAGRVALVGTAGILEDSANLAWDGSGLLVTGYVVTFGPSLRYGDTTYTGGSAAGSAAIWQGDTATDTTTSASATSTKGIYNGFGIPALAATNANVTTTDAATLYIGGAPTEGLNMTLTNSWSLWVDAGDVRIDGSIGGASHRVAKIWATDLDVTNGVASGITDQQIVYSVSGVLSGTTKMTWDGATVDIDGALETTGTITGTSGTFSGNLTVSGTGEHTFAGNVKISNTVQTDLIIENTTYAYDYRYYNAGIIFKGSGGSVAGNISFVDGVSNPWLEIRNVTDNVFLYAGPTNYWKFTWGSGGIVGPDGAVDDAAYGFNNDRDLGIYRVGSNQLGVTANGVLQGLWETTGLTITNQLTVSGTGDSSIMGDLGLGVASPDARLHVKKDNSAFTAGGQGTVYIEETVTGVDSALIFTSVATNAGTGNKGGVIFDAGATGVVTDNRLILTSETQTTIEEQLVLTSALATFNTSDLAVNNTGGDAKIFLQNAGVTRGILQSSGTSVILDSDSSLILKSNNTTALTLDASQNATLVGNFGVGIAVPLAGIHVQTSDVAIAISTGGDELVLENDGSTGMTIVSSATGEGKIMWADSVANDAAVIGYSHSTNNMTFRINGSNDHLTLASDGSTTFGGNLTASGTGTHNFAGDVKIDKTGTALLEIKTTGTDDSGVLLVNSAVNKWIMKNEGTDDSFRIYDYAGTADAFTIQTGGAVDIPGTLTVGTFSPTNLTVSGVVRIANTSGAVSTDADDLIVGNTDSSYGITIVGSTSGQSNLFFGDTFTTGGDSRIGQIRYVHSSDSMFIRAAGVDQITITASSVTLTQELIVSGTGTSTFAGNILTGTTTDHGGRITSIGQNYQFLGADNETNATAKNFRVGSVHYTNAEEPAVGLYVQSASANNYVNIGGGTGTGNSATDVRLYTAANNTTLNGTIRLAVNSSGRIIMGDSSATSYGQENEAAGAWTPRLQVNDSGNGGIAMTQWNNATAQGAYLWLAKSYGASVGTHALVNSGETLGEVFFSGSDGTTFNVAASIRGQTDGTCGANDMPGRLIFSTTADGANTPTERMRITSAGLITMGSTAVADMRLTLTGSAATSSAIDLYSASSFAQIKYDSGSDLRITNVEASADADIIFLVQDVNEAMRITGAGIVNIPGTLTVGTFSPSSLDVGGGYGSTGSTLSSGGNISANGALIVDGKAAFGTAVHATSNFFHVYSGGGAATSIDSAFLFQLGNDSTYNSTTALFHIINDGNRGTVGHGSGSDLLRLEFSDALGMVFDKDGDLGIRTAGKLLVWRAGNDRAGEFFCDNSATVVRSSATGNDPLYLEGGSATSPVYIRRATNNMARFNSDGMEVYGPMEAIHADEALVTWARTGANKWGLCSDSTGMYIRDITGGGIYFGIEETGHTGIGPLAYNPKATLHVLQASNNWEDGILIGHHAGNTGWNFHADDTATNDLFFGYNADTSVVLTGQDATKIMILHGTTGDIEIPAGTLTVQDAAALGGSITIGGSSSTATYLNMTSGNSAGSPAATNQIVMTGYEGRGQGILYKDSTYAGEEWWSGIGYSSGFNHWMIGYDYTGGTSEYLVNALLLVNDTGLVHMSGGLNGGNLRVGDIAAGSGVSTIFIEGYDTSARLVINSNNDGLGIAESTVYFQDDGGLKWQLGKSSSQSFFLYDAAAGETIITIASSGSDIDFDRDVSMHDNAVVDGTLAVGDYGIGSTNRARISDILVDPTQWETFNVHQEYQITVNATDYIKALDIEQNKYNIPTGVTNSGYNIGIAVQNFVSDSNFAGTIGTQYGAWIRNGTNVIGASGTRTITTLYGIYIEELKHNDATHTNSWGIYQNGATKNYFSGLIGIGETSPDAKLEINAKANGSGWGLHVNTTTRTSGEQYIIFGDDATPDFIIKTNNIISIYGSDMEYANADPNRKLVVNGGVTIDSGSMLAYDDNYYVHGYSYFDGNNEGDGLHHHGYYGHRWFYNGVACMTIPGQGHTASGSVWAHRGINVGNLIYSELYLGSDGIRIHGSGSGQYWTMEPGTDTFSIKDWSGNVLFQLNGATNSVYFPYELVSSGLATGNAILGFFHAFSDGDSKPSFYSKSNRDGSHINFDYNGNATLNEIGMTYYATGKTRMWLGSNIDSRSTSHVGPTQDHEGGPSILAIMNSNTDSFQVKRIAPAGQTTMDKLFEVYATGEIEIAPYGAATLADLSRNNHLTSPTISTYGWYRVAKVPGGSGGEASFDLAIWTTGTDAGDHAAEFHITIDDVSSSASSSMVHVKSKGGRKMNGITNIRIVKDTVLNYSYVDVYLIGSSGYTWKSVMTETYQMGVTRPELVAYTTIASLGANEVAVVDMEIVGAVYGYIGQTVAATTEFIYQAKNTDIEWYLLSGGSDEAWLHLGVTQRSGKRWGIANDANDDFIIRSHSLSEDIVKMDSSTDILSLLPDTDKNGKVDVGGTIGFSTGTAPDSTSNRLYRVGSTLYFNGSSLSAGSTGVTSVGLSLPSAEFTISGSPVTSSGTLTGVWKTQTAKYGFMAPSGGGTPTFRALVEADISDLGSYLTGITGQALGSLNNVSAAGPSTGDHLEWTGSTWEPVAPAGAGAGSLAGLTDTTISGPGEGEVLKYVSGSWQNSTISGSGSVTSVTLALSTEAEVLLGVTGTNPITGAGTFTIGLDTQTANKIFAGPTSGGVNEPTFRDMVKADMISVESYLPSASQGGIMIKGSSTWDVLAGNTTSTVKFLKMVSSNSVWSQISHADLSGSGLSGGEVLYSNGTDFVGSGAGTTGYVLTRGSGNTVSWEAAAGGGGALLDAEGELLYHDGTVQAQLSPGSTGDVLTIVANKPSWDAGNAIYDDVGSAQVILDGTLKAITGLTISNPAAGTYFYVLTVYAEDDSGGSSDTYLSATLIKNAAAQRIAQGNLLGGTAGQLGGHVTIHGTVTANGTDDFHVHAAAGQSGYKTQTISTLTMVRIGA